MRTPSQELQNVAPSNVQNTILSYVHVFNLFSNGIKAVQADTMYVRSQWGTDRPIRLSNLILCGPRV